MKTLYLRCGLSFSGKTTLARKIVERLQCAYISLDNINADVVVDDVNNFRWLRDPWRAAARSSCYHTVVIYLNIPHTELATRRRANQVTAERKGITEAVWAEHVSNFEPPGADEHVLRYGLTEDAESWVMDHFRP